MRRVMARLPQELQRMSLADRSALLSNKEALKTFLEQISRPLDPTLTMHRDEHIQWLDEPLWKREYQERTGRHMVTNTATNERITVDMFCQRHKTETVFFDSIQPYSQRTKVWLFERWCKRVLIIRAARNNLRALWTRTAQPWKWGKPMSAILQGRYANQAFRQTIADMLEPCFVPNFAWYLAAMIDGLVAAGGGWKVIQSRGIKADKQDVCSLLTKVAYDVLGLRERKKHSLSFYREKFSWLMQL